MEPKTAERSCAPAVAFEVTMLSKAAAPIGTYAARAQPVALDQAVHTGRADGGAEECR